MHTTQRRSWQLENRCWARRYCPGTGIAVWLPPMTDPEWMDDDGTRMISNGYSSQEIESMSAADFEDLLSL